MGNQRPQQSLITPSASPPLSQSFFPRPYRIPDQPSPTKRPRLSSMSRQNESQSAQPDDVNEFHRAREASAIRMLDIWASLAERHSRPLDEDDIVDIRTGNLVKDRGVLRGSQTWTLGVFADATAEVAEDEFEDEDVDELDTLTKPELDELGAERTVPPVAEKDPRDAEDLKDFLEAERRRREVYGSEPEESDGSVCDGHFEDTLTEVSRTSESAGFSDAANLKDSQDRAGAYPEPTRSSYEEPLDLGSDDELNSWGPDEISSSHPVSEADSDDEVLIIEKMPPPVMIPRLFGSSTRQRKSQYQLQTPPHSHTSSSIPPSSDDYFNELPESSPPPSSPFSSPTKSSPFKKPLHESGLGYKQTCLSDIERGRSRAPIPRLDLTKVSRGRPSESKHPHETSPSVTGSSRAPSSPEPAPSPVTRPKNIPKPTRVEVVIERRTPHPVLISQGPKRIRDNTPAPRLRSRKLAVETYSDEEYTESKDSIARFSPPVINKSKTRHSSPIQPHKLPSSEHTSSSMKHVTTPRHAHMPGKIKREQTGNSSTSGTKRKRVVSVTQTEANAFEPATTPAQSSSKNVVAPKVGRRLDSGQVEPDAVRVPTTKRRDDRRPSPERRLESPDLSDDDISDRELHKELQWRFSRAPSHAGDHPHHPYVHSLYPQSTPQLHGPHPHVYPPPIADPRAQFIISQAMHQLSALVGGAWSPTQVSRASTPFPPSHQHHPMGGSSAVYSSPVHPYPYPYEHGGIRTSDMHDVYYPPALGSIAGPRPGALVGRSQSRGRRVSFDIEENSTRFAATYPVSNEWGEEAISKESYQSQPGHATDSLTGRKGKEKMRQEGLDLDSSAQSDRPRGRRPPTRAQTPGPPDRSQGGTLSKGKSSARRKSR